MHTMSCAHRISEYKHPNRTFKPNLSAILVLGIFATVSAMPSNALAFESRLSHSPVPKLVARVKTYQSHVAFDESAQPDSTPYRTHAVVATGSPVTVPGKRAPKRVQPVRIAQAPAVVPTSDNPLVLEGEASYYSRAGCVGCNPLRIMANGQPLDDTALTMAIGADKKHLVGRKARVTSLSTGKSTVVTITDTGGFYQVKYGNRVADLTIASKQAIGMAGGVGQVRVEVF